jgi:nicotinic acid mononucleotide adenylyltransferase
LRGRLEVFDTPELIEVSSTLVREGRSHGDGVEDLVGVEVADYIDRHGLYLARRPSTRPHLVTSRR